MIEQDVSDVELKDLELTREEYDELNKAGFGCGFTSLVGYIFDIQEKEEILENSYKTR